MISDVIKFNGIKIQLGGANHKCSVFYRCLFLLGCFAATCIHHRKVLHIIYYTSVNRNKHNIVRAWVCVWVYGVYFYILYYIVSICAVRTIKTDRAECRRRRVVFTLALEGLGPEPQLWCVHSYNVCYIVL